MRYLIMSDIHGNLPALEKVVSYEVVDGYLILGDVVNYGPWSNECVDLLEGLDNCICLKGNHEEYFIEKVCEVKNAVVRSFFDQCIQGFDKFGIIENYQEEITFHGFTCVHTLDNKYIFHDTELTLERDTMIGHSHQQYNRTENGFTLLNPGSVGQNRKFINVIEYAMYDSDQNSFELKQLKYNVETVLSEMRNSNYPQECIDYYLNKPILN